MYPLYIVHIISFYRLTEYVALISHTQLKVSFDVCLPYQCVWLPVIWTIFLHSPQCIHLSRPLMTKTISNKSRDLCLVKVESANCKNNFGKTSIWCNFTNFTYLLMCVTCYIRVSIEDYLLPSNFANSKWTYLLTLRFG